MSVPGVTGIDFLRLQARRRRCSAKIGIGVARTLPQERVTLIAERWRPRSARSSRTPTSPMTTTPMALDDETALERVLLAAARAAARRPSRDRAGNRRTPVRVARSRTGRADAARGARGGQPARDMVREELGPDTGSRDAYRAARDARTGRTRCRTRRRRGRSPPISPTQPRPAGRHAGAQCARSTVRRTVVNYHCRVNPVLPSLKCTTPSTI